MSLKEKSSTVTLEYFLYGLIFRIFIVPKFKTIGSHNDPHLKNSPVASYNGNTYYFINHQKGD